jgi:exopolyphosphatase/guanosine-5'-triphosphate,3'-diphosphate pyrophosphatase
MHAFLLLMQVHKVDDYRAAATSAMREAKNGTMLIEEVCSKLNMDIKILSGSEEAALIHSTHIERRFHDNKNYLYIDVGGGSTELSLFSAGELIASKSFNLGTLRLLFGNEDPHEWESLKVWLNAYTPATKNLVVIGSGGNINKIYKLFDRKDWKPLFYKELKELHDKLKGLSLEERILNFKLHPDRADVIVPAAFIFMRIMKWGNIQEIQVPKMGLADGLIKSMHSRLDFSLLIDTDTQ